MSTGDAAKPGHGDHWLAALEPGDPRLADVLAIPTDAPDRPRLHRRALTETLDIVHVTAKRSLVTAYPEPRATTIAPLRPRELLLWETGVEAWLVADHPDAGVLTCFLTDLLERASEYQRARGAIHLELGALAYTVERALPTAGPSRLQPARAHDARFLPDDYWFTGEVRRVRGAGASVVLDVGLQGGLEIPIAARHAQASTARHAQGWVPGERVQGYLWLTARWPEEQAS